MTAGQAGPASLVVVGASAGGVEALPVLLHGLGTDFPAPVVIAQHLHPDRESALQAILQRKTELKVVLVTESEPLQAGRVYVVPANRHVRITDHHVAVAPTDGGGPRPSIDLLLTTAATSFADRLVAVILTGSGSDGAAGAVAVKNAGGVVVIQDPTTARYPAMPLALPPTAVDHVAELSAMGALLRDILCRPPGHAEDASTALPDIFERITRQAAIDFRPYKSTTILRRIARRMTVTRTASLREYADYLEAHPEEVSELVRTLLIQVTEFFRDPEAFEILKRDVLPRVIENARARGRVVRLWSAGCATGDEAYSLAMVLAELLGAERPEWNVKVFATDLDEAAVNFARRGLYTTNVLDNVPEEYRRRYFEPSDHGVRVTKLIRQMVIFGQQDLSRGVPFPRVDLVVCRNLLIYFQPKLQQELLDLFAYSLHETNGYLFLGKAETVRPSKAIFQLVNKKWKIYRCVGGPARVARAAQPQRPSARRPPNALERALEGAVAIGGVDSDFATVLRLNDLVLRNLPVGLCVVDRHYRIMSINATARRILGIREALGEQDFLHAARGLPYADIRAALDAFFRERGAAQLPELPLTATGVESRYVNLHLGGFHLPGMSDDYVIITVADVTEMVHAKRRLETAHGEQKHLADELGLTNRQLSEVNKELQDANEELQAANEELMLAQEELQATNEEFEATNEELQATNEELETNNEELHARTMELQELTRATEEDRRLLASALGAVPVPLAVFRAPELVLDAYSAAAVELMGARAVGRRLEEAFADESDIVDTVRAAYRSAAPATGGPRARGDGRSRYVLVATPHTSEEGVLGVTLSLREA